MNKPLPTRRSNRSEEGYILVGVMFMLALLVIAMSVAAPKIAKSIQRERELETMHRGKQYARAVKLYYKKFGAYPPNLDALVKTNEIRFLRKKYIDPTTGKDEWKIVRVGQQKTQSLGFFGQPIAGTGPVGMPGGIGAPGGIGTPGAIGQTGTTVGGLSSSNGTGFSSSTGDPSNGSTNSGNPTDPSSGANGTGQNGSGQNGGTGTGTSGTDPSGSFGNGQTFGGIGIMGFSPTSPKQSILVYKKKNHYNEWEFLYDPVAEQMMQQGGLAGGAGTGLGTLPNGSPTGGNPTPGSGPTFGGGGGPSFGNSGGSGGTTPTPTPQPQQ